MFERFTTSAKAAVVAAVEEAERRRDRHIGTEHLLLGLSRSRAPVAAGTFSRFGVDVEAVRAALADEDAASLASVGVDVDRRLVDFGAATPLGASGRSRRLRGRDHRPFTGGAKQTLEQALMEAKLARDRRLGAEHILLALTARPDLDPAYRLFERLGTHPDALRRELTSRMRRVVS